MERVCGRNWLDVGRECVESRARVVVGVESARGGRIIVSREARMIEGGSSCFSELSAPCFT